MPHPLRSRFRGAVLGAAIGDILGAAAQSSLPHPLGQSLEDGLQRFEPSTWEHSPSYGRSVVAVAEALTASQQHHPGFLELPEAVCSEMSGAGLAIASLPLALYHHEDLERLQRQLQGLVSNSQFAAEPDIWALVVGDSMALILQEQQAVRQLLPQVIMDLELPGQHPVVECLQQVQALLNRRASLSTAVQELRSPQTHPDAAPLLLALYCFLSTPDDFRLTVLRAVRAGEQPQLTGAIAGALSAAYLGLSGIPWHWRTRLSAPALALLWGRETSTQLLQIADRLLALWAGAYEPQLFLQQIKDATGAIAAPEVIRPR